MNTIEVSKMSKIVRLETMEVIWDSLHHEGDSEVESPAWHQEVLEGRKKRIAEGKSHFLSLEDVKSKHYR